MLKKEVAKLQAQISSMTTDPVRKEKTRTDENDLKELKQQVAELQAHLVPIVQGKYSEKSPASRSFPVKYRPKMMEPEMNRGERPTWNPTPRPRPGYCFHCGEMAI